METTISAKIERVRLFAENEEHDIERNVMITFDKKFDGREKVGDTYVDTQINQIGYSVKQFVYNVCQCNDDLSIYIDHLRNKSVEEKEVSPILSKVALFLKGATVEIDRTRHQAGEEYTNEDGVPTVYEYDGYNKRFLSLTLSDNMQERLDNVIDRIYNEL